MLRLLLFSLIFLHTVVLHAVPPTLQQQVLTHYSKPADSLKRKAASFLLANIQIHASQTYYWATQAGKRLFWDELTYPDFASGIAGFDSLRAKNGVLHPVPTTYKDVDTISPAYLIENIDLAFEVWPKPWNKNVSFDDFCEYILPYRASVEPLQNWRNVYYNRYKWVQDSLENHTIEQVLQLIATETKNWFINTWDLEKRKEPIPRLGALHLLQRKKGPCEDVADLMVFILRSQGLVVSNEMVTWWATSTGRHFCNNVLGDSGIRNRFDVSTGQPRFKTFEREPAKVIRTTYSNNVQTIGATEAMEHIPPGFMQFTNFKDVTAEYWQVSDLIVSLFSPQRDNSPIFACVFNGLTWQPTWWSSKRNGILQFTDMASGAVYLPAFFMNGKLIPAGLPLVNGYDSVYTLRPDTLHLQNLVVDQQDKYLIFRETKKYKLFWWNKYNWQLGGEQLYEGNKNKQQLIFKKIPSNTLYLLIPEYSQGKERPFTINSAGKRQWW